MWLRRKLVGFGLYWGAGGEEIKKPPRRQGRSGSKVLHRLRRARRRRSERLDGRDLHGGASASKHWGHR